MTENCGEITDGKKGGLFGGNVLESAWNYVKPYISRETVMEDNSDVYDFSHPRRGVALIVCNSKFEGQGDRKGSEFDAQHFEWTFRHLGFSAKDVRIRYNMTAADMMDWFVAVSCEDFSDCDALIVAISSHGDEYSYVERGRANVTLREDVVHSTDKIVFTRDLLDHFRDEHCPSLAGKPKIFLLQACRGTLLDPGVVVHEDMDVVDGPPPIQYTVSPSPCFKDYCLVYATPPGHFAFRRPSEGSWFVKALWEVVRKIEPGSVNFHKVLTKVIQKVALDYQSASTNVHINAKKQSGCIYSMLIKDVYFTPKHVY